MKTIAIDIRHAYGNLTGKGIYIFNVLHQLLQLDHRNQYILYTKANIPPLDLPNNAIIKQIKAPSLLWHFAVIRDLHKTKPDIFWAPTSYISPAHFRSRHTKTVITIHDLVALLFPNNHNKKAILIEKATIKKAISRASHVFAVSNHTAQDIQKQFHTQSISLTPCAANSDFQPLTKEASQKVLIHRHLPQKFILSVGTIEPRKNHLRLINAFAQISPDFPELHLVIAGGKGWQSQEIYDAAEAHPKVHLIGYVSQSELIALYSLAQAFIFPSLYEGFGIPPLEAMQCGCPVITSNSSSLPEAVGEAAITIDPLNTAEIAKAISSILTNDQLKTELIHHGFLQAKKFSWKKTAESILKIFNSL